VLENARSLDDAIGILQHATPLGAAAFVVVDGNSRQWAVVERTPSRFGVRRNQPPVITDLLTGEAFDDDPENDRAARIQPSTMRAQRVRRLLGQQRPAEPADLAAILRDRRSLTGTPLPLGHRGAVRDVSAVHTALFDASAMVLWVADGPDPGARMRAFDLRYELRGEGARPVLPGDLPPDADFEPSVTRQVRVALDHVRQARQHWQDGRRRQARELVQRALAHAPDLPEALKLAGDLARASGDREIAQQYYQRYLDIGPDDLGAEEEVRALLGRP
jgi:isopenicillin-N N-acyltransferase like protein